MISQSTQLGRSAGIYRIRNTINNKVYVGSAVVLASRWNLHTRQLHKNTHHNAPLQRAWDKYGPMYFVFEPLLICARKDTIFYEQRALDMMQPDYNISKYAARSGLGLKMSAENRAKVAARMKGHKYNVGRKNSPETIALMRERALTRPKTEWTEERREKMRQHLIEINKKRTYEGMSARMMGNTYAAGNRGVKRTEEFKRACSERMKGVSRPSTRKGTKQRLHTPEERARQSAGLKAWWAARKAAVT